MMHPEVKASCSFTNAHFLCQLFFFVCFCEHCCFFGGNLALCALVRRHRAENGEHQRGQHTNSSTPRPHQAQWHCVVCPGPQGWGSTVGAATSGFPCHHQETCSGTFLSLDPAQAQSHGQSQRDLLPATPGAFVGLLIQGWMISMKE